MKIEHIALWTLDLERLKDFYVGHFDCTAGPRYENPAKGFSSYFLSFPKGARLELMQRTDVTANAVGPYIGLAHFALSVGSEEAVRVFTERARAAGIPIRGEPRRTGDGYYESVIADPDGNAIEITV